MMEEWVWIVSYIVAHLVSNPPHPQSATKEERQKYSSYQRKATQICVKFYGSNDMCVHARAPPHHWTFLTLTLSPPV